MCGRRHPPWRGSKSTHAARPRTRRPGRPILGGESPVADLDRFTHHAAATRVMRAVKALRPYLDELGPARYNVLPLDVFTSPRTPAELLAKIVASINQRQADYDLFKQKIDAPDFDYLTLRPVVQDLLLLATPEVRQQVQDEIDAAQSWAVVKAIGMGAATIGLILLTIFPPTSALGVAGLIALEASLATYGVVSGFEMYRQGSLLSEGRGADDVIDPEQQKSADTMMAMGLVTVGLSALSLTTSGIRAISAGAGGERRRQRRGGGGDD